MLLAMPMFNNNEAYDIAKVIDHLKSYWGLHVEQTDDVDNKTAVFYIQGHMVAVAYMPVGVPMEDIEEVARYNYYWPTAINDLKNHTNHAIVSVWKKDDDLYP